MIDTHAHLLSLEDSDEIITQMKQDGLSKIFTISTTIEDSIENINLANKYDDIFAAVGIYPEYAAGVTDDDLLKLEELAKNKKVVAIGEIGLDYHTEGYDREKQIELFIKQLEIADKLDLPFCIHCRSAARDVYEVLSSHKHLIRHSGLMHCYSEGEEWIDKFVGLGLYISFSGNITYRKGDFEFLKQIPLDRLLVETDSPYLTPVPFRGSKNQPKYVKFVIEKLAKELDIPFAKLEKITEKNAKRFYFNEK